MLGVTNLNSTTFGILAIISACVIWGFAPIYYKLLIAVPPVELLAHRTCGLLYSFILFCLLQADIGSYGKLCLDQRT